MDPLTTQILAILSGYVGVNEDGVSLPVDEDIRSLGMDSISLLEFFAEIENQFNIRFSIDEMDLDRLNTVEAISALVAKKR